MALADVFDQWRSNSTDYVTAQIDTQLAAFAKRVSASGNTLLAVAKQLSDDPNLAVLAPLVTQAATTVERFASSFGGRDIGELWRDVERFARKQPWLATLAASGAGFTISRAVKASAKRRTNGTTLS